MKNSDEIRVALQKSEWMTSPFGMLSDISNTCSIDPETGREFVIRALAKRVELDKDYQSILDELAIQIGLHPYAIDLEELSLKSALLHAANRANGSMDELVLHSAQSKVLRQLLAGKSVILSAPTSFGKSLLIDVVISEKNFANIVLIVPTLALVEETRRRMAKFSDSYSIITSGNQPPSKNNIFVLTQERYLAMEHDMPTPDFFAIDEFYKLSIASEGDRATLLNQAFLKLLNTNAQFYLLGPSIKSVSDNALEKLDCQFILEDFQTVAIEFHIIPKKPSREEALAKLIDEIQGQTLIYCQSPASTRKLLVEYFKRRHIAETNDEELLDAAQWTSQNYHDRWLVSVALRHGIGIHHGRLPRSLGRFMIRAFEEGKLKLLLCTSTLIEGVNTAAKNVIIYDSKLNKKPLDYFTFNNIRGRSGRMFRHFIGNVYAFEPPPTDDLPFVDIPSVNPTETTPSSILIQLPWHSIPNNLQGKALSFIEQDILPITILKKLSGIEPEYLLDTARYLIDLPINELKTFGWSARPEYNDIQISSEVIWNQLAGSGVAKASTMRSSKMMTYWTWQLYASRNVPKFRRQMIDSQISNGIQPDDAVENVLAFLRGWASFNYPKYLMALHEIVNYVLLKRGLRGCNYTVFAASIEHLFQPNSFAALEEYGLPTEISAKLMAGNIFRKDDNLDVVIHSLKSKTISRFAANIFEKRVIEDFQTGIGVKIDSKPTSK